MAAWKRRSTIALALLLAVSAVGVMTAYRTSAPNTASESIETSSQSQDNNTALNRGDSVWPVFVNRPEGPPRVRTGVLDDLGRSVDISCASCHANFEPNLTLRRAEDLTEFHLGLHFDHGNMSCVTCHSANNYNMLRLADGSEVGFEHVQTMCAQCHSKEARDFERGAHGGMTGYWDRTRGPQVRKNCIDCHDPHSPAFPHMIPTFKPHDRFLEMPRE